MFPPKGGRGDSTPLFYHACVEFSTFCTPPDISQPSVSPRIKNKRGGGGIEHLEAVYAWAHTLLAYATILCCVNGTSSTHVTLNNLHTPSRG